MRKRHLLITVLMLAAPCALTTSAKHIPPREKPSELLRREEMMVLNLDRGPKSTHYYLLESLKATRTIQKSLERARHQVEQVDGSFAKAKNRPDDRTMNSTVQRIKAAEQTAQQLEQQLKEAEDELKADIKQTLIR
jgi:hypothetical protein